MSAKLKNYSLIALGTMCLATGIIGIFTPILPTTPFLLLAAYCYLRSSARFHRWLMNNRVLGGYIRNYTEGRGIPLRVKLLTIALLWVTIGISILAASNAIITAILLTVAVGVTLHIAFIRPRKNKPN